MRNRLTRVRGWTWTLAVPIAAAAVTTQLAFAGSASATRIGGGTAARHLAGTIAPAKVNNLDCNGWSNKYTAAKPGMKALCTDPLRRYHGHATRFYDNGHYVGHDEPLVKFISSVKGSGNTMTYEMRLPKDPVKAPTASGSVTDYEELSIAPWFGLPICDPRSYPQNPCTPDSDANTGLGAPTDAGSAFMELQFYPPGWAPFTDLGSCSATQYCSALNIDSLEATFGFTTINTNCEEPVNFSFLQTNGLPPGPPAPQDPNSATFLGNAKTLRMNPGDVLKVAISDPAGGFTTTIHDLTSGQTGTMQASAKNGFANTNISDCSGTPHTFHAEYSTARQPNQVPWAALEGGVLMQQEIGHFEPCNSVVSKEGFSASYKDGTSYSDPNIFQTCSGGTEGPSAKGEGPCNPSTGVCQHAMTQGANGPAACPSSNFTSGNQCEYSDGYGVPKGTRTVFVNGKAAKETARLAGTFQNQFENGDVDFDGTSYLADWPNGSTKFPQPFEYIGPFMASGKSYAQIQYETNVGASEALCNVSTGVGCTAPPAGAKFYPFWSINNKQTMKGIVNRPGVCIWNFGNDIAGITKSDFGKDKQYGTPDIARFGGTSTSKVLRNPTLGSGCKAPPPR